MRDEAVAFEHFARAHPDNVVLLIDTYDTEAGAVKVASLAPVLHALGISIKGVRLDSGDLAAHARKVRDILNKAGLESTTIFASGNLDEYRLNELVSAGAPIDGFGVGTALDISADAPSLDFVYKLQEYAGKARRKRSEGKATWPGRKQVYRSYNGSDGTMARDVVALGKNDSQEGEPLIMPVMREGKRIDAPAPLDEMRTRTLYGYRRLPKSMANLEQAAVYPVEISAPLRGLANLLDADPAQAEPA